MHTRTLRRMGAFAALAATLASAAPPKVDPFIGRWHYEAVGSKFEGRAPYQEAAVTFSAEPAGTRVAEDVVTANGAKFHFEYVDPQDGRFVPVAGNPYYDSESTVWSDARTATRRERRGGKDTGATVMTLAADGKSFTSDARRTVPEGHLYTAFVIWKRVDR